MSNSREIKVMRLMAWDRAKGELRAILNTYWGEDERYKDMRDEIDNFIASVEGEGLQE